MQKTISWRDDECNILAFVFCVLVEDQKINNALDQNNRQGPESKRATPASHQAGPCIFRRGKTAYSTQPNVRSTAFFHPRYPVSRSVAVMCGSQIRSTAQFLHSSSVSRQNPTASPAA